MLNLSDSNSNIPYRVINFYSPLFIILYNLSGNLSNDIYLPTLPALLNYFDTSIFFVQLTMTAWFLGVALPQLYFGMIADKYGRRPVMLWGGALFLSSTLVCIFAPYLSILILGRFFQGVGVSSLNVATYASVKSHHYDEQASIKFLSYINVTGFMAPIIGPVLGSYIYNYFGWRSTFVFIFFLSAFAIMGLYHYMLESFDESKKNDIQCNIRNLWVFYQPVIANSKIIGAVLAQSFFIGALIAYLTSVPFIMKYTYSIPIKDFGSTQIIPFSFFILGGVFVAKLINFVKIQKIIISSFILILFSLILFNLTPWCNKTIQIYFFLSASSIFLSGFAMASSPLISEAMTAVSLKGLASAIVGLSMAIMATVSSLLIALFFEKKLNHFIIIMNIFSILGILSYIYFKIRNRYAKNN